MKLLLAIFLCLFYLNSFSQNNTPKSDVGLIIGNVVEGETGKPVAGATVAISRYDDSLFRRQQATDKTGSFEIESIAFGIYRISISSVGFATFILDSINIRTERFDFNLGD
ncbi:MAG TPA: carboxypeptidase-like regulatory domain-containing protein, partial [Segetibacter sp.]